MTKQKYIALVDCDSFFVSCEQKRNPKLKSQAVCVLSNNEGCVISRSNEAKKMGVRMGEPYFMAKKEHPKAIYITADHEYYSKVSHDVMSVLKDFSPYVQIYSIDEAFVDFTGLTRLYGKNYYKLALYLREKIKNEVDIPVSIGVSSTKTLSKLASDKAKHIKNGVYLIGKSRLKKELKDTKIDEIWGIGRSLTKKLKGNGILNAQELVNKSDSWLEKEIGIRGIEMRHELVGQMVSKVVNVEKLPKSIQNTRAFGIFTSDFNYIKNELNRHIHTSCRKLRSYNTKCLQIGVMLRTKDFRVFYTKKELLFPVDFELEISNIAIGLLKEIYNPNILYRSTGIVFEKIGEESCEQLSLYSEVSDVKKKEKLAKCFDKLESKFGKNIIQTGFTKLPQKK
jgi:nucleotidyltransferase/DNA polymerase involved in DNA repair